MVRSEGGEEVVVEEEEGEKEEEEEGRGEEGWRVDGGGGGEGEKRREWSRFVSSYSWRQREKSWINFIGRRLETRDSCNISESMLVRSAKVSMVTATMEEEGELKGRENGRMGVRGERRDRENRTDENRIE